MKRWVKLMSIFLVCVLLFSQSFVSYAGTNISVIRKYIVTSTDGSGIPNTIQYNENGATGTLTKYSVQYTVTKTKQVPVYKNVSKTFTKTVTKFNATKNNSIFPSTYTINEDGYQGTIPRTSVSWTERWIRNRKSSTVTKTVEKDTTTSNPDFSGTTVSVTVTDPLTGKSVTGNIPYYSKTLDRTYTTQSTQTEVSYGEFRWLSNDPVYYTKGKWSDPYPANPVSYYGDKPGTGWKAVSSVWIGPLTGPVNPPIISESGIANKYYRWVRTRYERAVTVTTTHYVFKVTYRGQVNLPDYLEGYDGTATYSGTLTKQVIDHYDTVPIEWEATVEYRGYVNKAPTASITVNSYTITGQPLSVGCSYSDPDGTVTGVSWTVSPSTGVTHNLGNNGGTIQFANPGTYTLSLKVTDNDGRSTTVSKTIQVYEDKNKTPVADFEISPNPAYNNLPVNYINKSYDPNGYGFETAEWTVIMPDGIQKVYTNTTPPAVFEDAGWGTGTYKIRLRVKTNTFSEVKDGRTLIYPGKWSAPVEKTLTVLNGLKFESITLLDAVNAPKEAKLPSTLPVSEPVPIKAGYYLTFLLRSRAADSAEIRFYVNGNRINVYDDNGEHECLTISPIASSQEFKLYFDKDLPEGSVIDMKIILYQQLTDGSVRSVVDTNSGYHFARIAGSAKKDSSINLTN